MRQKALFLVFVLGTIYSCKEKNVVDQDNQAIFDYYKKNVQTFELSSDKPQTIFGNEGTKIIIDVNSLETIDGKEISGDVEIQLTEYYRLTDLILANLSTSSDSKLIETGGMINLTASSNGQKVVVKKGKEFVIEFSSIEKEGMEIFYGEMKDKSINWKPKTKSIQIGKAGFSILQDEASSYLDVVAEDAVAVISETDSIVKTNILNSTEFGWINCDRFLEFENLTTLKVNHDTIFQPSAYVVFRELNSIMPCFYEKTSRTFINLPIGYEATLVAFSIVGEKTYFSSRDLVIVRDMDVKVEFKEVALGKIKDEVEKIIN